MYFQKVGGTTTNSLDNFSLVLQDVPLSIGRKVKQPTKRSWYDEDGDDEYVPSRLVVESLDLKCKFIYKGAVGTANSIYETFTSYLTGADGTGAEFSLWDDWSRCGFASARFSSIETSEVFRTWNEDNDGDDDIVGVSVEFRILTPRESWTPSLNT